ncbi:hypothetical protein D7Y11_31630 [Corallococcus sp. AB018]|uniref:hypothetical protein n=1 Tax=Corallococcus sp. AB018 TaxID=2316715 RepID=UPI000F860BF1|nr:hypothetical protein [Corallococcus sp. AB018]RUO89198.1 hypothetical protein D7Y11_31630 [Corallococcus sp. AB018]
MLLALNTGLVELTSEVALRWSRDTGSQLPDFVDEDGLDLFLATQDRIYRQDEFAQFLLDLVRFLQVRMSIKVALKNLDAYEARLGEQKVSPELVRKMLGVKAFPKTKEAQALHDDVAQVVDSMLDEEWDYIEECRASLYEQLDWHTSRGDKSGRVSSGRLQKALKSVTAEDLKKDQGKSRAKFQYYEPVRLRLMSLGFVVSPAGTPLGAVFPASDWVRDLPLESQFWEKVKERTDALVQDYHLLGNDSSALTRLLKPPVDHPLSEEFKKNWRTVCTAFVSTVGCLCVSWTRHQEGGKTVYVPVLGLSGVVQEEPDEKYFGKYCRHLALPTWKTDQEVPKKDPDKYKSPEEIEKLRKELKEESSDFLKKRWKGKNKIVLDEDQQSQLDTHERRQAELELLDFYARRRQAEAHEEEEFKKGLWTNYDVMIGRTNTAALEYRARDLLQLRRPARQALLSYVSFRQNKTHDKLRIEAHPVSGLQGRALGVDLWICGWHSLNCAEPAALMTASSYFCDGADVLVCFPYEGFQDTGKQRNRPKETCPWCAAVELGFRSLSRNTGQVDKSVETGDWVTEFTRATQNEPSKVLSPKQEFDAFDDSNPITVSTRKTLSGNNGLALVKNNNLDDRAYSEVVETKIGRIRSMYHLLGLLDPEVIALDRPLFGQQKLLGSGALTGSGRGRGSRQRPLVGLDKGGTKNNLLKEMEHWSKQAESRIRSEAELRLQRATALFDMYVQQNFVITDNPGGGDCLYYAFSDGVKRRTPQSVAQLPEGDRLEEAMLYRESAAAMTANLIRRGVGISPVMFRDMRPSQDVLRRLDNASTALDRIRLDAWASVRLRRGLRVDYAFRDTDPRYAEHVALAETFVMEAVRRNVELSESLRVIADAYESGQRRRRQWAGDLDFRGLVLSARVNLRIHYVDTSERGIRDHHGHRVDTYDFRELSAQYFGSNVPGAAITIDILHVGDNHYVAGRRA